MSNWNVKRRLEIVALLTVAWAAPAMAQPSALVVTDGWFRVLPGKPAAGYFNARSTGGAAIAITGAQADGCASLMLKKSTAKDGMAVVDKVSVPAGGGVAFAPGGYHLTCTNPKLKIGSRVGVDLDLSDGSHVVTAFQVRGAR